MATPAQLDPSRIQKNSLIELEIKDLAFGGKALAKVGEFVVFVDDAVPGDVVRVRITKRKSNFAEGEVAELLKPSPKRIQPRCAASHYCGGCSWQSLPYEEQLRYKQRLAESIVEHLGKARPDRIEPIIPSPEQWRYRNKMDYTFGSDEAGRPIVGFHYPGAFDRIFEVKSCHLQPEPMDRILQALSGWVRARNLTSYDPRTFKGFLRHLLMRHSVTTDEYSVVLMTNEGKLPTPDDLVACLKQACPSLKGFVWGVNTSVADVARMEKELFRWGNPVLEEHLGDLTFRVSPFAFFQVNTPAAQRLYGVVRDMLGENCGSLRLLDAYCGTGTIGIFCASKVRDVVGIEIVREAVWDARENAARNGFDNCTFLVGQMRQTLPILAQNGGGEFGAIVVDPPRGGMDKQSLRALLNLDAPLLIYVSCNPTTLSRDIVTIQEAGYHAEVMQPVDLFPQTYHIETVMRFVKSTPKA